MISKNEIQDMKKEIESFDKKRDFIIQKSRFICKLSKKVIYSVHRNDLSKAALSLKNLQKEIKELKKIAKQHPKLESSNSYSVALQEYVEAYCFYVFVKDKKLTTRKMLDVDSESYLLGLCDLTGELGRKAVIAATNKKKKEVLMIRALVDDIFGMMLEFDLRNSELRKKSDSIKWNLKKIEEIVYDISMK